MGDLFNKDSKQPIIVQSTNITSALKKAGFTDEIFLITERSNEHIVTFKNGRVLKVSKVSFYINFSIEPFNDNPDSRYTIWDKGGEYKIEETD
jgi:hypothetical protein